MKNNPPNKEEKFLQEIKIISFYLEEEKISDLNK